jgi:hypothetical protein
MLVLFVLLAVSGIGVTQGILSASQLINSYGTIAVDKSTTGTAVRPYQVMWGGFTMAQETLACANFDALTVGYWGDPGADYQYIPQYKLDYPNIKIFGYIDLSLITSASWMVNQWNTYGAPYDYDGIFIDNCKAGYAGYTQASLDSLLETLRTDLPNMMICANGVGDVNNGVPVADTYNYVNIGMLEEFAYAQNWGRSTQHDIDSLAYWTSRGVTIGTFHSGPYTGDSRTNVADTLADCTYALASYLCGVQNNNGYFSWTEVWKAPSYGYYPIMNFDPGTPLGPYTQSGSILTRQFTKCNVTVDLSAMTGTIVTT